MIAAPELNLERITAVPDVLYLQAYVLKDTGRLKRSGKVRSTISSRKIAEITGALDHLQDLQEQL